MTATAAAVALPDNPDRVLFEKYNIAGPRYTSYPTVPYWQNDLTPDAWVSHLDAELAAAATRGEKAGLYIHIPFCRSLCTFCACNKLVTQHRGRVEPYINAVLTEWATYLARLGVSQFPLAEMHLGGGTPTYLTGEELQRLLNPILERCETTGAALSFEADPRVTTLDHLAALYGLGYRRISLGIQDYDPEVQTRIHRVQSVEEVSRLTNAARDMGYASINYDLVYGLPRQTLASIEATIAAIEVQRPDRIAFYSYAHVPWIGKTGQRGFEDSDLPTGPEKRALYELGRARLAAAGYVEVGLDHFALPGEALEVAARTGTLFRNFMGYLPEHMSPLLGLGVSAIGDSWTAFGQNEKDFGAYVTAAQAGELPVTRGHVLTSEDLGLRGLILDIMTRGEADWSGLGDQELQVWLSGRAARLAPLVADGLVQVDGASLQVTPRGKPFLRNVAMAFDARLEAHKPETQLFSQTV